jgi:hypothetical protein
VLTFKTRWYLIVPFNLTLEDSIFSFFYFFHHLVFQKEHNVLQAGSVCFRPYVKGWGGTYRALSCRKGGEAPTELCPAERVGKHLPSSVLQKGWGGTTELGPAERVGRHLPRSVLQKRLFPILTHSALFPHRFRPFK